MLPARMQQVINAILAAGLVTTAVFTGLTATTGTFTNLTATNATITNLTTAGAVTSTLSALTVGTLNSTTTIHSALTSSTQMKVGQGTAIDLHRSVSSTIDAYLLVGGAVTSTPVTVTGAVIGDMVTVGRQGNWGGVTSSSVMIYGSITAADTATLYFRNLNATTTSDIATSTYILDVWSHAY